MNLQEKILETTTAIRDQAVRMATSALNTAQTNAVRASARVGNLRASFITISGAGRKLVKLARQHGKRFAKENSAIASEAGKDLSAIAKDTYSSLIGGRAIAVKRPRKPISRKRTHSKRAA